MFHSIWPYLGGLGQLVEVPSTSSESADQTARYVEKTTLEGRRRVQALAATPRSWSVDVQPSHGRDLSGVLAFLAGAWGPGPWHWVPVAAQAGNMLTPREAMLAERRPNALWTEGGPVVGTDGTLAPRSMLSARESSWASMFIDIPCLPGRAITWSADVAGDGSAPPSLVSVFADANGDQIGGGVTEHGHASEGMQRVSQTRIPPEGAASFRVGIYHTAKRITRPQVTWTDAPVPFAPGHGCRAAIVDGHSEDLIVANKFGTWSTAQFTVMEVG